MNACTRLIRALAFPPGIDSTGATLREGGMGVHMPTVGDADPGIPNRGVAPVHVRPARCGAAGTTAGPQTVGNPATWRDSPCTSNRHFLAHTPHCLMCACGSARSLADPISIALVRPHKHLDIQPPRLEARHGDRRRFWRSGYPRRVGIPATCRTTQAPSRTTQFREPDCWIARMVVATLRTPARHGCPWKELQQSRAASSRRGR